MVTRSASISRSHAATQFVAVLRRSTNPDLAFRPAPSPQLHGALRRFEAVELSGEPGHGSAGVAASGADRSRDPTGARSTWRPNASPTSCGDRGTAGSRSLRAWQRTVRHGAQIGPAPASLRGDRHEPRNTRDPERLLSRVGTANSEAASCE